MNHERIQEQICDLKRQKNIQKLEKLDEQTYKFLYTPKGLKVQLYNNRKYPMQLILPKQYPEKPPILIFSQKIYHLNVSPTTGQIRMSVIENEWTPFLSLCSIIQSLDHIMDQPQQDYPADSDIQIEFKNKKSKYYANINTSPEKVFMDSVQFVTCMSTKRLVSQNEQAEESEGKDYVLQDKKNSSLEGLPQTISQQYFFEQTSKQMQKSQLSNMAQNKINKKNSSSFGKEQVRQLKNNDKPLQKYSNGEEKTDGSQTLQRINQMITIFIQEINGIQEQIKLTSNHEVAKLLTKARDEHIHMLKSLLQISEQAKWAILKKIKYEVQKM